MDSQRYSEQASQHVPMVCSSASSSPHARLGSDWQANSDTHHRKKVLSEIVSILHQRKPQARPGWIKKVPQLARRLEDAFYMNASSFEDYNDLTSLRQMPLDLVLKLGTRKAHGAKLPHRTQGGRNRGMQVHGPLVGRWQASTDLPYRKHILIEIIAVLHRHQPQAQSNWAEQVPQMSRDLEDVLYRSASAFADYNDITTLGRRLQQAIMRLGREAEQAKQKQPARKEGGLNQDRNFVNMSDSNPMIVQSAEGNNNNNNGMQQNGGSDTNTMGAQEGGRSNQPNVLRTPASYTPEQRKQALWQQQQRLLLLRHASKCQAPPDTCTDTPHCAKMKSLWKHIAECKDSSCKVAHCISSRFVLSHYHRCEDPKCDVCAPVKEVIHKSGVKKQPQATHNAQDLCARVNGLVFSDNKTRPQAAVNAQGSVIGEGTKGLVAVIGPLEKQTERERSVGLHMKLLDHAVACALQPCPSANCARMKALLAHGSQCEIRVQNGCQLCRRVWALLQIHARQCKREICSVPKCVQLREHMRQLEAQQA